MKKGASVEARAFGLALCAAMALLSVTTALAAEKRGFQLDGVFVEGCSCTPPCRCEMTEPMMGCLGVGAMSITSGEFQGTNLSGAKFAYAVGVGEWVRLYVDAKDDKQVKAVEELAKALYGPFGKLEGVERAKIVIKGDAGAYTATVNDGKVFSLKTEPILGGDGKTALVYNNIKSVLHPSIKQGRTVSLSYNGGGHSFDLEDTNAYFHDKLKVKGEVE